MSRGARHVGVAALAMTVGLLAAACGAQSPEAPTSKPEADGRPTQQVNPLAGAGFYVNPASTARAAVDEARRKGKPADAAALLAIADQPTAVWFAGQYDAPRTTQKVRELTKAAERANQVAVIVLYNLPGRDCGHYSKGGARDPASYVASVRALAEGIEDRRAVVVVEPDAVPHAIEGCEGVPTDQRYDLLQQAVTILDGPPNTAVYLDAGNADWIDNTQKLADALRRSGIDKADGFALNVSNFETTDASARYGKQISDQLGGAHYVIDTSRNGNGSPPHSNQAEGRWCNPPDRALGTPPTSNSGIARVDALLWIKQPGDSDGTCRGGPAAGTWWPELAQDLLR